ncbi:MAG: hypothetical protein JXA18_12555 [Chitinispirillaceae bacterium]|nr:hypothetical protein [Chitinispirillaceae bacterium]
MRRNERMNESLFGIENSSIDPNRFYSILLDARAASVSENMCDIAEKLLTGEKENAKGALEHLWRLKKNLFSGKNGTLDLLINYYQEKMDILRGKEEHLKKVSLDSRTLLEEKRKKDEEVATVKQQVADCTKELSELTEKFDKLKIKEQELTLIEHQLREELNRNENEIVNGLYEIILTQQEAAVEGAVTAASGQPSDAPTELPPPLLTAADKLTSLQPDTASGTAVFEPPVIPAPPEKKAVSGNENDGDEVPLQEETCPPPQRTDPLPFPKSVVKTTGGRVIGEYYYDGKVYKNERHYIFNAEFFGEELIHYARQLKKKFELSIYTEMLQMIQDAAKRITDNKRLHFEVATNEILNEKSVKRLWQDAKLRSIEEVERFGARLRAKIAALGNNYVGILKEQMERCIEKY